MSPRHRFRPLVSRRLARGGCTTAGRPCGAHMALSERRGRGNRRTAADCYYSIGCVASSRSASEPRSGLRRPNDSRDPALLLADRVVHGVLSSRPAAGLAIFDRFFEWADSFASPCAAGRCSSTLPRLPERHDRGAQTRGPSAAAPGLICLPSPSVWPGAGHGSDLPVGEVAVWIGGSNAGLSLYLAACLLAGLGVMVRALTRLRP